MRGEREKKRSRGSGNSAIFVLLPCGNWRKYCNAHMQDTLGTVGINVGDGVVLLLRVYELTYVPQSFY